MKELPAPPSPQDTDLFRQAVDGVTPLAPSDKVAQRTPPRRPPKFATHSPAPADTLSDHGPDGEPLAEFLRPGITRMALRKLKRERAQDSLDLHGLHSDAARKLLLEFLAHSTQRGLRCVNIIHGKGWQPGGGEGVLKIRTRNWLTQCAEVLAFCEAPPHAGGGGAVLVLLKAQR